MIICTIKTSDCTPQTIVIGRRATYDTLQVVFDLAYLAEAYGSGTAVLVVKRSQDETAYPAIITQDGNTLTWTISETDTYYVGAGECELMWYVNDGLAKTIIYPVVVMRDILQTAEAAPDAYENWVESLTALGAETQQNALDAAQSATDAETAADRAEDALEEFTTPTASATSLAPEAQATAAYSSGHFTFGIPRGAPGAPGSPGYSPAVTITTITGGHRFTVTDKDHPTGQSFDVMNGAPGAPGSPGQDGYSPAITITTITGGHRFTVTDEDHPTGQSFDVMDGTKGDQGYSPAVTITTITGGHRVTITDEDHPTGQSFDVLDGASDAGQVTFDPTQTYPNGSVGKALSDELNAISQLAGGTTYQFLVKASNTDYDFSWVTVPNANGVNF